MAEIVYLRHNNVIGRQTKIDGSAEDLSAVTKITATFDDVTVESTDHISGEIRWYNDGYVSGEIRFCLGSNANINPGAYSVPVVTYDLDNPNGVVWGTIDVIVKDEVEN